MLKSKKAIKKKVQKGRTKHNYQIKLFTKNKNKETFRVYSLQSYRLTEKQLESARFTITRLLTRENCKLRALAFSSIPVTKKPKEVRMGKGKGNVDFFASKVYKGYSLFEISGGDLKKNKRALISGSKKLPIRTLIQNVKA